MRERDRQITMGSLISIAREAGWDANPWRAKANQPQPAGKGAPLDLSAFDITNIWGRIPHREWLLPPILIAKHYSMLVATGASGKSAVAITTALALATGRSDMLEMSVVKPCKVLLINGEDSQEELARRIRATCLHFGIELADISSRLAVIGARQVSGLTFNKLHPGGVIADDQGLNLLADLIQQTGADVVMIDPLGSFLPGGTNDGAAASAVAGRLTEICVNLGCAMLLVHHTSKMAQREGSIDPTAALGSAMWTNHARAVWVVRRPSKAEAQAIGRPPSAARDLLILSHSKANLSRAEDEMWIEMVSVELPNAQPPLYPTGDKVGVATRFKPGVGTDLFTAELRRQVARKIDAGTSAGLPFKASGRKSAQDYRPMVVGMLSSIFPGETPEALLKMAKSLVESMIAKGELVIVVESMPRSGAGKGGGKQAPILRAPHQTDFRGTGAPEGTSDVSEHEVRECTGIRSPPQRGTELPIGGVGEAGAPATSEIIQAEGKI